MAKPINLLHTCKEHDNQQCASCMLIDLTIQVLRLFNSRPDYFKEQIGQELIARALLVNMAVQESVGVIKTTKTSIN